MPKKDDKLLKSNNGEKSRKVPFIIMLTSILYLKKQTLVIINPEKSS